MMNKAQLKIISPVKIKNSEYFKILSNSNIKGSTAYQLDWTYILEEIDKYRTINKKNQMVILDIGCGNSMFHTFLEEYLGQGIIGIDRNDSTFNKEELIEMGHTITNATDLCIDFIEIGNTFFNNNVDIIYWNSSIEHNSLEKMQEAINISMRALKKGGLFLATWAIGETTHWSESASATILSKKDASDLFKGEWVDDSNFKKIVNEWKDDILDLDSWHRNRFGNDDYEYIHAGCFMFKN